METFPVLGREGPGYFYYWLLGPDARIPRLSTINLSYQRPHLTGATLPALLRAVHSGTTALTYFRLELMAQQGAHSPPWALGIAEPDK